MSQPSTTSKYHQFAKVIDGGLAGMVGVTATFPLDLAKTRLQNESKIGKSKSNLFTVLKELKKTDGLKSWYRGFGVNFGMITFEKAIKLTFNDWFRTALTNKETGYLSVPSQVLAGGSAGFFQSCVTTPMELLKIKMQIGEKNVIQNIKNEGFASLYKGWGATLLRDIPFSCFYFPIYANLKEIEPFGGGAWWNLTSGLLSGASAGLLVTPMDVIKTRKQAAKGELKWLGCAVDIYKNEGISSFFKGSVPRMICIGSLFAVAQVMYELQLGDKIINKILEK